MVTVVATVFQPLDIDHLVLNEAIEQGQRIRSRWVRVPGSPEPLVDDAHSAGSQRAPLPARTRRPGSGRPG
jgi:hypothetical protein